MRWPPWSCFNIKCHWNSNSHNIKMRWSHGHLLFILKGIQIPWKMASYWNMVLSSRIPLHDHPLDACSAPLPWQPVMLPWQFAEIDGLPAPDIELMIRQWSLVYPEKFNTTQANAKSSTHYMIVDIYWLSMSPLWPWQELLFWLSSHYNLFEDKPPLDFIYRCPIS